MHFIKTHRIIACVVCAAAAIGLAWPESSFAAIESMPDSGATTEFNCSFGMGKDEAAQSCQVPIPPGCVVARFPGTDKPWTSISKGGNTQCRFDNKATNWKTRITGTCGKCKTGHCSVQFIVKFDCSRRK
jgi:hypothetical protein